MITMIKSKAKQGGSNEMLRRFMGDSRDAVYITNKFDYREILNKIKKLECEGVSFSVTSGKAIHTLQYLININSLFDIIMKNKNKVLYIDMSLDLEVREAVKTFCKNINLYYRDVYMTEQLNANWIDGVLIVRER